MVVVKIRKLNRPMLFFVAWLSVGASVVNSADFQSPLVVSPTSLIASDANPSQSIIEFSPDLAFLANADNEKTINSPLFHQSNELLINSLPLTKTVVDFPLTVASIPIQMAQTDLLFNLDLKPYLNR